MFKINLSLYMMFTFCTISISAQVDISSTLLKGNLNIHIDSLSFPIHKVAMCDSTLWATDYGNGIVYKSSDYGKSFFVIDTLGSEYFETIQFINSDIGFISGDYGYVYKTEDGGKTWQEISPPIENRIKERYRNDPSKDQSPDGMFVAYYSMYFKSPLNGYVSGFKFNPKKGFRDSFKRLFYLTKDGGNSWSFVEKANQNQIIESFKSSVSDKSKIGNEYFISDQLSWTTGKDKFKNDIIIQRNYQINKSDSLILPETEFSKIILRDVLFINKNIGFIFGGSLDEENEKAVIFSTIDGGKKWNYIKSDMPHIHTVIADHQYLFLFGKNGFNKRNTIETIIKGLEE